jgi:hypothetical protein
MYGLSLSARPNSSRSKYVASGSNLTLHARQEGYGSHPLAWHMAQRFRAVRRSLLGLVYRSLDSGCGEGDVRVVAWNFFGHCVRIKGSFVSRCQSTYGFPRCGMLLAAQDGLLLMCD